MINYVLKYLFLFSTGAIIGWLIELIFRRFFGKTRKWINPGFLSGPYLPLYGSGTCILYIISDFPIPLLYKVIIICSLMTFIELVTGLFFLKYYKVRLWDYSNMFLNYKGVVCPLFSVFWTILGLFFYFVLYPYFYNKIEFLYQHLEFSLLIGIFYGVFIIDLINTLNIVSKIKDIIDKAEHMNPVNFENIKQEIRDRFDRLTFSKHPKFFQPFRGVDIKVFLNKINPKK